MICVHQRPEQFNGLMRTYLLKKRKDKTNERENSTTKEYLERIYQLEQFFSICFGLCAGLKSEISTYRTDPF
jgi:hypothetical protein